MRHEDYFKNLRLAAEQSAKWGSISLGEIQRTPEDGCARDSLDLVGRLVNSNPMDSLDIRLSCGEVHAWLFRHLQEAGIMCALTIGDVEVEGKMEFKANYQNLKDEIQGKIHTDDPCNFHVWLTFPDMHIIDATFFVYKYYDAIPIPWRWSDYLICSDNHLLSEELNIRYIPLLVGDESLVEDIIYHIR